jgi:potassium/hydrogen antiporter
LQHFFDNLAGLLEIVMFLTLGLLVFPSHLVPVIFPGILLAAVLIFIARPAGVWISLWFSKFNRREKAFISWVDLRGAAPIILATYPLLAGLNQSSLIFNAVFFVVLSSILIQGTSVPIIARWLKVEEKGIPKPRYPLMLSDQQEWEGMLKEILVQPDSYAAGKAVYQLGLPQEYLVVMIAREEKFVIPNGSTVLKANDRLLGLANQETHDAVNWLLAQAKEK